MSDLIQDHLSENQYWMQQAIDLARRGQYSAKPNPNVGCVIVKDGKIIGEGFLSQSRSATRRSICTSTSWRKMPKMPRHM